MKNIPSSGNKSEATVRLHNKAPARIRVGALLLRPSLTPLRLFLHRFLRFSSLTAHTVSRRPEGQGLVLVTLQ
ncbi:hypothetical protein HYR99_27835 [Candidatus Poribacteria bacterium]|nr:hypothetical protein [Candidatus Poribacteria bacterium]